MAAPSYTHDLQNVDLAESTTGWNAYGGGASGLSASPDLSMQGTNCVDKQISNADKGQYFDNGSGITLPAGAHVYVWLFCGTPGLVDTIQNKGVSVYLGTGTAAYCQYHTDGKDTYGAAGRVGRCYPINYSVRTTNSSPPYRTASGTPGANPQLFGGGLVTTASVKGANCGVDAIRYGTGAYLTAGELLSAGDASDNPCTFDGFQSVNDNVTNRYGILTSVAGAYNLQGTFAIGQNNSQVATLCRFRDSNKTINFADTIHAASTFNKIIVDHASTRCEWTNINLRALGTQSPGALTVTTNNPTFIVNGGTYNGIGATTLQSNSTLTGVTWLGCQPITMNGGKALSCTVSGYVGTADTSALIWNTATDPDGKLDGSSFVSGSATHAIEFSTAAPLTMTLRNIDFSGYTNTQGSANAPLYIKRTSGTVTISLVGCTGITANGYKSDGATVVLVLDPVTVTAHAVTVAGANIQDARVHIEATGTTKNPFPVGDTVTITNSGTTATVSHTNHGMATNDKVVIRGASHDANNGVFSITVTGANSYTYTMGSAPGSDPTGTITSTFVVLNGLTNVNGVLSTTRVYSSDQQVTGQIRKSTTAPNRYKEAPIVGSVDSVNDTTFTGVMISDE